MFEGWMRQGSGRHFRISEYGDEDAIFDFADPTPELAALFTGRKTIENIPTDAKINPEKKNQGNIWLKQIKSWDGNEKLGAMSRAVGLEGHKNRGGLIRRFANGGMVDTVEPRIKDKRPYLTAKFAAENVTKHVVDPEWEDMYWDENEWEGKTTMKIVEGLTAKFFANAVIPKGMKERPANWPKQNSKVLEIEGRIDKEEPYPGFHVTHTLPIDPAYYGQGWGSAGYALLAGRVRSQGVKGFYSDRTVSPSASMVWDNLARHYPNLFPQGIQLIDRSQANRLQEFRGQKKRGKLKRRNPASSLHSDKPVFGTDFREINYANKGGRIGFQDGGEAVAGGHYSVSSDTAGLGSWQAVKKFAAQIREGAYPGIKKINFVAGPSGAGKTFQSQQMGASPLMNFADAANASELTFEIGGNKIENVLDLIALAKQTSGSGVYLSPSAEQLDKQRRSRAAKAKLGKGDPLDKRSAKALRGTKHAPKAGDEASVQMLAALQQAFPNLLVKKMASGGVVGFNDGGIARRGKKPKGLKSGDWFEDDNFKYHVLQNVPSKSHIVYGDYGGGFGQIPVEYMNLVHGGQKEGKNVWRRRQGFIEGGPAGVDTVPAMLTPGEYVINKKSASAIGLGKLNRMNQVGKYAKGGMVQRFKSGGPAKSIDDDFALMAGMDPTIIADFQAQMEYTNASVKEANAAFEKYKKEIVKGTGRAEATDKDERRALKVRKESYKAIRQEVKARLKAEKAAEKEAKAREKASDKAAAEKEKGGGLSGGQKVAAFGMLVSTAASALAQMGDSTNETVKELANFTTATIAAAGTAQAMGNQLGQSFGKMFNMGDKATAQLGKSLGMIGMVGMAAYQAWDWWMSKEQEKVDKEIKEGDIAGAGRAREDSLGLGLKDKLWNIVDRNMIEPFKAFGLNINSSLDDQLADMKKAGMNVSGMAESTMDMPQAVARLIPGMNVLITAIDGVGAAAGLDPGARRRTDAAADFARFKAAQERVGIEHKKLTDFAGSDVVKQKGMADPVVFAKMTDQLRGLEAAAYDVTKTSRGGIKYEDAKNKALVGAKPAIDAFVKGQTEAAMKTGVKSKQWVESVEWGRKAVVAKALADKMTAAEAKQAGIEFVKAQNTLVDLKAAEIAAIRASNAQFLFLAARAKALGVILNEMGEFSLRAAESANRMSSIMDEIGGGAGKATNKGFGTVGQTEGARFQAGGLAGAGRFAQEVKDAEVLKDTSKFAAITQAAGTGPDRAKKIDKELNRELAALPEAVRDDLIPKMKAAMLKGDDGLADLQKLTDEAYKNITSKTEAGLNEILKKWESGLKQMVQGIDQHAKASESAKQAQLKVVDLQAKHTAMMDKAQGKTGQPGIIAEQRTRGRAQASFEHYKRVGGTAGIAGGALGGGGAATMGLNVAATQAEINRLGGEIARTTAIRKIHQAAIERGAGNAKFHNQELMKATEAEQKLRNQKKALIDVYKEAADVTERRSGQIFRQANNK